MTEHRVDIPADQVPAVSRRMIRAGLASSLANLAAYLEQPPTTPE